MQLLKKIILGILTTFLFISCKNSNAQNLEASISDNSIDFLSEKYSTDFRLNIDGYTRADHPLYDYLDCKEEVFFVVHFIPKTEALQSYWLHDFLKENSYEYDDAVLENKFIQKEIKNNYKEYNIFACHVTKKYIKNPEDCTEEAVHFKKGSETDVYVYNPDQKTWRYLNFISTNKNPLYYNSKYFKEHYPDLFAEKNQSETSKSLAYYQNNDSYFIAEIDVNKDKIPDRIVSSRAYKGNELIFFIKDKESYKLSLKTINLSEEGGNTIDSIYAPDNNNVLAISTYFPDKGHSKATHYINYENDTWVLTESVYETSHSTATDTTTYTCSVPQNLSMHKLMDPEYAQTIKHMPAEQQRDSVCKKVVVKN